MKRLAVLSLILSLLLVGTPSLAAPLSGTFSDDDGNVHEPNIQAIAAEAITLGCGGDRYCPAATVRRDEMASFLARALDLAPVGSGPFTDIAGNIHTDAINAIAAAGITLGCTSDRYCPADPVRRDEMASFLARAFDLAAAPSPFTDTTGNVHEANIGAIAADGITLGCAVNLYCPAGLVRRDEMASFLARALDLEPVYVLLGMGRGLPLDCTKDGLVCTASFVVPHRPAYAISEGFYQVLPYVGDEQAEFESTSTRFELRVDGVLQQLDSVTTTPTYSTERRFEGTIGLPTGSHQLIGRWYW
ncbi:MAG: S-layer homology domain-containing protein, partial [Acidimicrobiia bacterium]